MAEHVTHLPSTRQPKVLEIDTALGMSPNEMEAVCEIAGKSLDEIFGGADDDANRTPDRSRALAWVTLRRQGVDVSWHEAGDYVVRAVTPEPNPSSVDTGTVSQPSHATGG